MRKHFIDNLRWLDVLLLIPYHAAQAWNVWGEPNYIFFEGNKAISSIIVFFSPYFMPLLFLLAGMSTRYSLEKRTYKQYLTERAKRLLVPLVFGTLVFMPVMTFLADKYNYGYDGGFFQHYVIFFTKYTDLIGADGGFSFGQFWFLLYLFAISLIALGIIDLQERCFPKTKSDIPFLIVNLLGVPLPFLNGMLSVGGKSLAEFCYIFLVGYYVFADKKVIDKARKYAPLTLTIGLTASVVNVYMFIWSGIDYPLGNSIATYTSKWFMLSALIGLGKAFLDRSGKISQYMSKRSFAFFGFHFIWVVLFQYLASRLLSHNTVMLYIIPVFLAYIVTFICCEICVRSPLLSFLMGTKYVSKKPNARNNSALKRALHFIAPR